MRIMETKVYTFDELSESAKKKAIDKLRDINTDYEWYDGTIENITLFLEILGFSEVVISFSGFWSQGDGASFTGKYRFNAEWEKALNEHFPNDGKWKEFGIALECASKYLQKRGEGCIEAEISRSTHHYCHENTVSFNVYSSEDRYANIPDDEEDSFVDTCKNIMRHIYKELGEEYRYLSSDEVVIETIKANEYEFTEDGRMV